MVIIDIKTKELGAVYSVRDLLHSYLEKYSSLSIDASKMQVTVSGSSKKDVERAMKIFSRGMSVGGHGGYRFNYKIRTEIIKLEEIISSLQSELDSLNEKMKSIKKENIVLKDKIEKLKKSKANE